MKKIITIMILLISFNASADTKELRKTFKTLTGVTGNLGANTAEGNGPGGVRVLTIQELIERLAAKDCRELKELIESVDLTGSGQGLYNATQKSTLIYEQRSCVTKVGALCHEGRKVNHKCIDNLKLDMAETEAAQGLN